MFIVLLTLILWLLYAEHREVKFRSGRAQNSRPAGLLRNPDSVSGPGKAITAHYVSVTGLRAVFERC